MFIAVFSTDMFNKLFIKADDKFTESASAAFLGAFLAFLFIRIGDYFKSYSDRVTKNHSALVKLQHNLNYLLNTLNDNIYFINKFEDIYEKNVNNANQTNIFVWTNKLRSVTLIDELILDLLNIDLVNELFILNIHLRKFNDSAETLNDTYLESKDAMISKKIDVENYMSNIQVLYGDLADIKKIINSYINEATEALSAIRVLAKKKPIMGYVVQKIAGHKYSHNFKKKRSEELSKLQKELRESKDTSSQKIQSVLNNENNKS